MINTTMPINKRAIMILFTLIFMLLGACGGGSNTDGNPSNGGGSGGVPIDNRIYPYVDTISFTSGASSGKEVGAIFTLTDNTLWEISGSTGHDRARLSGLHKLTIRKGTASMATPEHGKKTDYFMVIPDVSAVFFVTPLLTSIESKKVDSIKFTVGNSSGKEYGGVFTATDKSVWEISGSTGHDRARISNLHDFTIYKGTSLVSSPTHGRKTDFFMLIPDLSALFFVTPLENAKKVQTDTIQFTTGNSNGIEVGGIFTLTDQSIWEITGSTGHDRARILGTHSLNIYKGTEAMGAPEHGNKTNYFMSITDKASTFFVTPL